MPIQDIIYAIYSDTNDSYLCWDETDKYYYFGQKNDKNILCWSSPDALSKFYDVAIKTLSVMRTPNLCPRCATLIRNKT